MKTILSAFLLCGLTVVSLAGERKMQEVPWSWTQIDRGSIMIDLTNWVDLAVIRDTNGLAAFNAKYGVRITPSSELLTSNVIVVVFSDLHIGFDGVGQSRRNEYCISLFDLGIDIETLEPPPGKRCVHLHAVSLPKEVANGTIYIRRPQPARRVDYRKE